MLDHNEVPLTPDDKKVAKLAEPSIPDCGKVIHISWPSALH